MKNNNETINEAIKMLKAIKEKASRSTIFYCLREVIELLQKELARKNIENSQKNEGESK